MAETNLKKIRQAKKLTQAQVFEPAGISKSYYSEIESGKRQLNGRLIERLAKVLGVEGHMLVVDTENSDEVRFVRNYALLTDGSKRVLHDLAASLAKERNND